MKKQPIILGPLYITDDLKILAAFSKLKSDLKTLKPRKTSLTRITSVEFKNAAGEIVGRILL